MSLRSKKAELDQEASLLKYANYEVWEEQFIMYYVFGGVIIIAGAMIALAIYIFAKKREIRAFKIQQSMPVTQEAIGKMAPIVGNAVGEVTKGFREGLKDNPEDNDKTPNLNNDKTE